MDKPNVRVFTAAELARFDGKEGRPGYVALGDVVYDVSSSLLWQDGEHEGEHQAGMAFSEDILSGAPHGYELIELFPVIGVLE